MKRIIAFVGLPGGGKSEAASFAKQKGIPFIRFGDLTEEEIKKRGLDLNPVNEKNVRESLRNEFGMDAYAKKAIPKIDELLKENELIGIDGLYSWEEYLLLKEKYKELELILIYAEPKIRYERLSKRPIRPLSPNEARERDYAEINNLNKGGPIAIADYLIENNGSISDLHKKLDELFKKLKIWFI